jgi:hypothetical protein
MEIERPSKSETVDCITILLVELLESLHGELGAPFEVKVRSQVVELIQRLEEVLKR